MRRTRAQKNNNSKYNKMTGKYVRSGVKEEMLRRKQKNQRTERIYVNKKMEKIKEWKSR